MHLNFTKADEDFHHLFLFGSCHHAIGAAGIRTIITPCGPMASSLPSNDFLLAPWRHTRGRKLVFMDYYFRKCRRVSCELHLSLRVFFFYQYRITSFSLSLVTIFKSPIDFDRSGNRFNIYVPYDILYYWECNDQKDFEHLKLFIYTIWKWEIHLIQLLLK